MRNASVFFLCNKNGGPSRYKGGFYMASYTQHYQLHQWEPSDDFLRTDFNDDFKKIDAAIHDSEEGLRTNLTSEISRLDTALGSLEQRVNTTHSGDIQRLDAALSAAQQTLRNEFNGNLANVNTQIQNLEGKKVELATGSYTGDNALTRIISLGFTPRAVIVENLTGQRDRICYGGLAVTDGPLMHNPNVTTPAIQIVTGGFQVAYKLYSSETNVENTIYRYMALK